MRRIAIALALLFLSIPKPAEAGGWVVVSLDAVPGGIVAGVEQEVGFVLRQHGVHLVNGFPVELQFTHRETGERLTVAAKDTGRDGRYIARFALPKAGRWDWNIWTWNRLHPMPPLQVLGSAPEQSKAPVSPEFAQAGSLVSYGPAAEPAGPPLATLAVPVLGLGLILAVRSRRILLPPIPKR